MKLIQRTALLAGATCLTMFADAIPYADIGSVAPTGAFTAAVNGNIIAYFDGSDAMDGDTVTLFVNGIARGTGVDNETSALGESFNLASVNAGDVLEFKINNMTTHQQFSSVPADSQDGINHVYAASFSGDAIHGIPAGTYLGFEDLALSGSDLDYNDDSLVVTNVSIATNAEPSSEALLGGCLLVLGIVLRRQTRVAD